MFYIYILYIILIISQGEIITNLTWDFETILWEMPKPWAEIKPHKKRGPALGRTPKIKFGELHKKQGEISSIWRYQKGDEKQGWFFTPWQSAVKKIKINFKMYKITKKEKRKIFVKNNKKKKYFCERSQHFYPGGDSTKIVVLLL